VNEDRTLRVPVPKMSQDFREKLVKQIAQMAEQAKVRIRHHRQDARTALKKANVSLEESRRYDKEVKIPFRTLYVYVR
jgi:ribosome recycling factor